VILCSLALVLIPGISFAEKPSEDKKEFLQGMEIKLQKMLAEATTDAQKSNAEIRNCEDTIRKAENIIRAGREANRAEVEAKGRQTLFFRNHQN
jgi:hypothetical protein